MSLDINTTFAHHGTRGSSLGPLPDYTPPKWTIGGQAMVTWQIRNNHGGGYQYRLCPANEELTEECFQAHPLEFVREKQAIVFANGTRLPINGTFVDGDQVQPANSTWSMIPIPPTWLGPRCIPGRFSASQYQVFAECRLFIFLSCKPLRSQRHSDHSK